LNRSRAEKRMAARVFEGVRDGIHVGFGGAATPWEWFDAMADSIEEANERHAIEYAEVQASKSPGVM